MDFIKILFNIVFTLLPLLLQLLLQIPATRTTSENEFRNTETTTIATSTSTSTATAAATTTARTTTNSQTTTATPTTKTTSNDKNKNNITTGELRKHEQIIDNSIDFAVDPCDDFYQYACGEWKHQFYDNNDNDDENDDDDDGLKQSENDAADESDKYDRTLAVIDYLADKEVLKYFKARNMTKKLNATQTVTSSSSPTTTSATRATNEPDFIIKVYKYYKSCIATQQYEPIKYLEWLELNEHVKWPSLINTTTATNNEDQDAEMMDEDEIIMDDDYDEDKDKQFSQDFNSTWINTLAVLRKYGMNGIFIEEIIYNTKTFPSKLLLGFNKPTKEGGFKSLKNDQLKTILNNLNLNFTADSFKNLWLQISKFEWQLTRLNDISDDLGTVMISLENVPLPWLNNYLRIIFNQTTALDINMRLVITNVAYFVALDDLLNNYEDTFLKQYLQIRFLWHLYQQEPQEFQPLDCILHIKSYMPLAFEWIYEKQHEHLNEETTHISDIFNSLRKQFNHTLYNNKNNFASKTLEKFASKLESIQFKVGTFADLDQSALFYENRKFYNALKLSSHEFYFNHLKMLNFNFNALHFGMRNISSASLFYDMQEYSRGISAAPYFNQRLNILHIPLSLLQPPVYHADYGDVYNYSSLGFILAQTLMYAFSFSGLAVNEQAKIMQHLQCLSSLDNVEINDKIADVSGLRLAYRTFFHKANNNLIANRKIFFLNFAHTFCGKHTLDDLGRSPLNYALAQFNEFAKTFECSPDSHMNPYEKCFLWD